jgi:hypothetical protein
MGVLVLPDGDLLVADWNLPRMDAGSRQHGADRPRGRHANPGEGIAEGGHGNAPFRGVQTSART